MFPILAYQQNYLENLTIFSQIVVPSYPHPQPQNILNQILELNLEFTNLYIKALQVGLMINRVGNY